MNDAWQRLEPLLRPGERLRWAGRPDPKVRFTQADLFLVPFSLLWCGFVIVWETLAITRGAPVYFALFGIPFVLAGLYFVFGRFVYKGRRKRSTVYGLTESRAIASTGGQSLQDISLKGISTRTARSRDGRHVTVTFGTGRPTPYLNTGMDFFAFGSQPLGFFDVADPDGLLRELDAMRQ